ncbi:MULTISPECIES: hypothetical protein [Moraxella]|uniref:Lipoprotein n=1 Tax=Moraxella catarrhalis TaxID=480 RepID=A0A7Z1A458_MORCA|nr:hypothetical protein [Moraxella catarrhalis]OAV00663.1 hypothetical protein AO382_1217 [Moraxella catarrhalis]STY82869.1 Uncharacterised protein [Moraxella catarrhalis]
MLNKGILSVIVMTILGCSQSDIEQLKTPTDTHSNHQQAVIAPPTQKEPFVFVAHFFKRDEVGNTALYTGILNEKNGCLYIDDCLILVTGVYVKWQNQPFWIGSHHGEKFKLGDTVSVGGSETNYTKDFIDDINNPNCVADKIWLTLSIDKPFI